MIMTTKLLSFVFFFLLYLYSARAVLTPKESMPSHLGVRGQACTNPWKRALKLERGQEDVFLLPWGLCDTAFCQQSAVSGRGAFNIFTDLKFFKGKYWWYTPVPQMTDKKVRHRTSPFSAYALGWQLADIYRETFLAYWISISTLFSYD